MLVAHFMPKIIVSNIFNVAKILPTFYLLTRFTKIRIINIVRITPYVCDLITFIEMKLKIESQYIFGAEKRKPM